MKWKSCINWKPARFILLSIKNANARIGSKERFRLAVAGNVSKNGECIFTSFFFGLFSTHQHQFSFRLCNYEWVSEWIFRRKKNIERSQSGLKTAFLFALTWAHTMETCLGALFTHHENSWNGSDTYESQSHTAPPVNVIQLGLWFTILSLCYETHSQFVAAKSAGIENDEHIFTTTRTASRSWCVALLYFMH